MISMYFSDNQTKQKAFDRYYNAMAKSNFKQGRKLQALINQEAEDEAMTEKMSSLYASSTAKQHDYEYDTISKKMVKKVEKPVSQLKESKTKTRTYVHESTDVKSEAPPARPRRSSIEMFMEDQKTDEFIRTTRVWDGRRDTKPTNQDIKNRANQYVKQYQKEQKQKKMNSNRMNASDAKLAKEMLAEVIASDGDDVSSDTSSVKREIAQERTEAAVNPSIRREYTNEIEDFKPYARQKLYKQMKAKYENLVDARKGNGYFVKNFTQPKGSSGRQKMDAYKTELKGMLD
ncbi:hypothetical protein BBJ28_00026240, partial [Nothophytophthora sp. Chile5]